MHSPGDVTVHKDQEADWDKPHRLALWAGQSELLFQGYKLNFESWEALEIKGS